MSASTSAIPLLVPASSTLPKSSLNFSPPSTVTSKISHGTRGYETTSNGFEINRNKLTPESKVFLKRTLSPIISLQDKTHANNGNVGSGARRENHNGKNRPSDLSEKLSQPNQLLNMSKGSVSTSSLSSSSTSSSAVSSSSVWSHSYSSSSLMVDQDFDFNDERRPSENNNSGTDITLPSSQPGLSKSPEYLKPTLLNHSHASPNQHTHTRKSSSLSNISRQSSTEHEINQSPVILSTNMRQHTRSQSNNESFMMRKHGDGPSGDSTPTISAYNTAAAKFNGRKVSQNMTLEDHLMLGIKLHEEGKLRESSYHIQYAAFKGDPSAMLIYGLTLRHGWGIRANPQESIEWLKKATAHITGKGINLNLKDTNFQMIQGFENSLNNKNKKAKIGLALYELGMSYLHSWGIEKDETAALQFFELAGSLGDVDALCEAAGLWMHHGSGHSGHKKDLHKAAKLYREAIDRGANLVGISWVYKDKYLKETRSETKQKKEDERRELKSAKEGQSETSEKRRTIFSKKK
ncbi:hypothetical protein NADFUDRAFT_82993 [Nadsonia fulvescens var. elongata DSM 6958]|uniref:HCP-like protein n=1 Tax=Nadsonia fulvescens var. elongata DSM 6958 TaxID=857566 RepID=A0A1E3PL26_9ASCO|nr:hypothetical protein NADFUDRAFT_82993 [Nadsonia fulvescens var. elongata DSM 6958]